MELAQQIEFAFPFMLAGNLMVVLPAYFFADKDFTDGTLVVTNLILLTKCLSLVILYFN